MKSKYIALALAIPVLFTACENPADKTNAATVGEAVEKTTTNAEGGTKYVFTEASTVNFVGSKVTGSHSGGFKKVDGHFTLKDGVLAGNDHKVVIDIESLWSDSDKLTEHLKAADFFDAEKYPQATFDVTSLTKNSDSTYKIAGNFTLHGVTKNITFDAKSSESGDVVKIDSKFDINRKDFGIVYAGKTDDLIRDEVVIELKLEVKPGA